jgi:thiamine-phosphate pyrophosphorylase
MDDFGIYVIITDPVLSYRTIAEICVEEGIGVLQLREKKLSDEDIVRIGKEIREVTHSTKTRFLINDRPDLAALCEADGFHLGQKDISLQKAKTIYPNPLCRGLSTHNISQVKEALALMPDYIGFGPVYTTPTKEKPDPVTGTEMLIKVLSITSKLERKIPVVAIGGIDETNIDNVLKTGVKNVALVRYFMRSRDLRSRIRTIKSLCESYWG